jgi:cysteine desulfurase
MAGIYLDHSATTPVRPEVVEAMLPYLGASFGNPSSIHFYGQQAKAALDQSRDILAGSLDAIPAEIIFTGGGTEADNLALLGTLLASPESRRHFITSAVEHDAILKTAEFLNKIGCSVTIVGVDSEGIVDPADVASAIREDTALVSIMHGNNEVGAIQNIEEISKITQDRGVLLHSDAVQTFGQLNVNVEKLGVDLLSVSSHKIYGPKGVGALYVRQGTPIVAEIYGGGQERGRRSGTENVPGIVGFATAVELLHNDRSETASQMAVLRDRFIDRALNEIPGAFLNGPTGAKRLPNNINLSFQNIEGEALLLNLDIAGIAASSGSACSAGSIDSSHVLVAMGIESSRSRGAIRLSLGRTTTAAELDACFEILAETTARLTEMYSHSLR